MAGATAALVLLLTGGEVFGAGKPANEIVLVPLKAIYLVTRDTNVRAKPATKSQQIGKLKKGQKIKPLGMAKGTGWIAVRIGNGETGYVYFKMMAPMIDGALKSALKGKLSRTGAPDCRYRINFKGKSEVEADVQRISDYSVAFKCTADKKLLDFNAAMFLTELPYREASTGTYQINVDLRQMPVEEKDDDVLSVTVLFEPEKSKISFDVLTDAGFSSGEKIKPEKAATVSDALKGAVSMAYRSWGKKAWDQLTLEAP
ncbi:MAG: SH3 domain-containing protein [Rhodospirillales bacterium]|nr:SH3 domain-containing protein [Rhodospirillales bacterium]